MKICIAYILISFYTEIKTTYLNEIMNRTRIEHIEKIEKMIL